MSVSKIQHHFGPPRPILSTALRASCSEQRNQKKHATIAFGTPVSSIISDCSVMVLRIASWACCLGFAAIAVSEGTYNVPPFSRNLQVQTPLLTGRDVITAQRLLCNPPFKASINADGFYGTETAAAVQKFQASMGLSADGVVGPKTATALLKTQFFDGYQLQNITAASMGYKYMVSVHVAGSALSHPLACASPAALCLFCRSQFLYTPTAV